MIKMSNKSTWFVGQQIHREFIVGQLSYDLEMVVKYTGIVVITRMVSTKLNKVSDDWKHTCVATFGDS